MENMALILIFWYGILHAFGADHLTAIADFSIGKKQKKNNAYYKYVCSRSWNIAFYFCKNT